MFVKFYRVKYHSFTFFSAFSIISRKTFITNYCINVDLCCLLELLFITFRYDCDVERF